MNDVAWLINVLCVDITMYVCLQLCLQGVGSETRNGG